MDDSVYIPNQYINIETLFRLFLDLLRGGIYVDTNPLALWFQTHFYPIFAAISTSFSLAMLTIVTYSLIRLHQIRKQQYAAVREPLQKTTATKADSEDLAPLPGAAKWALVQKHVNSENPAEWRLAILEADILLDVLVRDLRLPGENLGERLKAADRKRFVTIDQAWEAHKIRNAIAHEGSGFTLGQREAKRVISLYQLVFQEFNYI